MMKKRSVMLLLWLTVILPLGVAQPSHVLDLDGEGDYVKLPDDMFNDLSEATVEIWVKWKDFRFYAQSFNFGKAY